MKSLPLAVEWTTGKTAEFTEETIPDALRASHQTKAGTWGRIVVVEGRLLYRILRSPMEEVRLDHGNPGIIEPQVREHEVRPLGKVRFFVEFYRIGPPPADFARAERDAVRPIRYLNRARSPMPTPPPSSICGELPGRGKQPLGGRCSNTNAASSPPSVPISTTRLCVVLVLSPFVFEVLTSSECTPRHKPSEDERARIAIASAQIARESGLIAR